MISFISLSLLKYHFFQAQGFVGAVLVLLLTLSSQSIRANPGDGEKDLQNRQGASIWGLNRFRFKSVDAEGVELIGALWAIAQDQDGFIWFGGENGLARFDGYEVKIYRNHVDNKRSISSSYIRDILLDSKGRLWVATNYGLNLYHPETDDFTRYVNIANNPNSLSGNDVRDLVEDAKGRLWLATGAGGLNRFDPSSQRFTAYTHNPDQASSLANNSLYRLAIDAEGALWIGTTNNGLDRLVLARGEDPAKAQFEHFYNHQDDPASLSGNQVRSILVDKSNQLWVGTTEGLNRFDRSSGKFSRFVHDEKNASSLSFNFVQALAEDSEGNLWVATSGEGLNLFDRNKQEFIHYQHHVSDKNSLQNNNVRVLFLDSIGNFWAGHYAAGVSMLDRYASAFKNIYHNSYVDSSLNYNEIVALAENFDGNIWVGTPKGLNLYHRDSERVSRYSHDPNNPGSIRHGGVLNMIMDSQQRLWVGLWGAA